MTYSRRSLVVISCLVAGLFGPCAAAEEPASATAPGSGEAIFFLETWIQSILDYARLPGISLAVVQGQEIIYSKGFGFSDTGRRVEATPDTVYSICSISKIFTGIAVMQLRDAGKLKLDDPAARHLPWFKPDLPEADSATPTVRDLLRHSGGLPCEPDFTVWNDPARVNPSRQELIERSARVKMIYFPGTTFNYSNLGYALLGEIVSTVSGTDYTEYVQRNIIEPLGLKSTTPFKPDRAPGLEVAQGYGPWPRAGSRAKIVTFAQNAMTPAAGFASTVHDLAKFAMWQLRVLDGVNETVLSAQSLREMHAIHWQEPKWGLGFTIWEKGDEYFVGHQGGCSGYKSQIIICPEKKIAVVVMVNATDAPQFTLAFRTFEIMAPLLSGDHSSESNRDTWAEYVGYYTGTHIWSAAEVLSWRGELVVMWVPGGNPDPVGSLVKLARVDGEVFRQVGADGELGKHFVFDRDDNGNVTAMKFNNNILTRTPR